jgi:hypothetical protein
MAKELEGGGAAKTSNHTLDARDLFGCKTDKVERIRTHRF